MALAFNPGWYWYDYQLSARPEVQAFQRQHAAQFQIRKTFTASAAEIIVFEILGGPLVWGLPGLPQKAPKKLDTGPADIAQSQSLSPGLVATLEELVGKPIEAIKRTAANANLALNVLIFGGVAVLLWNLYQNTRAPEVEES